MSASNSYDGHASSLENNLVSVIIVNRNHAQWIKTSIESCLQQDYPHIEILFVDDCSEDNSLEIVKAYPSVRILQTNSHSGPACARNIGMKYAQGSFIQFLDSDDFIASNKISRQLEDIVKYDADFSVGGWRYVINTSLGEYPLASMDLPSKERMLEETIINGKWFPLMCCLFKKNFLNEIGPWNEKLKWNEDTEYRLRILLKKPRVSYVRKNTFMYRKHSRFTRSRMKDPKVYLDYLKHIIELLGEGSESKLSVWYAGCLLIKKSFSLSNGLYESEVRECWKRFVLKSPEHMHEILFSINVLERHVDSRYRNLFLLFEKQIPEVVFRDLVFFYLFFISWFKKYFYSPFKRDQFDYVDNLLG